MRCYTLPSDNSGSEHISAQIQGQSPFWSKVLHEHIRGADGGRRHHMPARWHISWFRYYMPRY